MSIDLLFHIRKYNKYVNKALTILDVNTDTVFVGASGGISKTVKQIRVDLLHFTVCSGLAILHVQDNWWKPQLQLL